MSKFIIIRKDLGSDPMVIEREGLTLGRLTGNDLILDHPVVSRVHSAIQGADGDYWLFNLSEENCTLLNGEEIEQAPLTEGDVIQIGPFFLTAKYDGGDLCLEIEYGAGRPITESLGAGRENPQDVRTIRFDPTRAPMSEEVAQFRRNDP